MLREKRYIDAQRTDGQNNRPWPLRALNYLFACMTDRSPVQCAYKERNNQGRTEKLLREGETEGGGRGRILNKKYFFCDILNKKGGGGGGGKRTDKKGWLDNE